MSGRSGTPIDALVADCFHMATEAILQERKAQLRPITTASQVYPDYAEYVRQAMSGWKRQINSPLTLDLYLFVPKTNEHVLLERWNFSYQLHSDLKDNRPFSFINRRVQTLLRSLYCFVRMLPGFNMLPLSSQKPLISFQLYNDQRISPSTFKHEVSKYQFAKISTSKGLLSIAVTFLNSSPVKSMIKSISGGVLSGVPSSSSGSSATSTSTSSTPVPIRRDSKTATAAIPIPQQASSYEAGGMTRPRTISDSRENHRKSFQIPEQSRPDFARSLDNNNKSDPAGIHHSSPFRPNDPSHLFGSSPNIPIKSSPTSGTSPSQYTGGLYGYPPMPPAPGSSYDSRTTPVGSYSHSTPPFAYQQYMEERNSEGSGGSRNTSVDYLTGASPPFPQFSSSLTSTSPHFPSFLNNMASERKNSFRKNSIGGNPGMAPPPVLNAANLNALSSHGSNPNSMHSSSATGNTNAGLLPTYDGNSQALIATTPEWEHFKARLTLPMSPFSILSRSSNLGNVTNMALIPGGSQSSLGKMLNENNRSGNNNSYGKSALATIFNEVSDVNNSSQLNAAPTENSNKLDSVINFERERERRRHSGSFDFFSALPTGDHHSTSDHSRSVAGMNNDDNEGEIDIDEDLPFAFNPNDLSASILAKRNQPTSEQTSTVELILIDIRRKLQDYRQFVAANNGIESANK